MSFSCWVDLRICIRVSLLSVVVCCDPVKGKFSFALWRDLVIFWCWHVFISNNLFDALINVFSFKNNQADQICYAVLCVFSYVAAGSEQRKKAETNWKLIISRPNNRHTDVGTSLDSLVTIVVVLNDFTRSFCHGIASGVAIIIYLVMVRFIQNRMDSWQTPFGYSLLVLVINEYKNCFTYWSYHLSDRDFIAIVTCLSLFLDKPTL